MKQIIARLISVLLCWYHVDDSDYRLSLLDEQGLEVLEGPLIVEELSLELQSDGQYVVKYPLRDSLLGLIPSTTETEKWVITAQKMINGELAVGIPTTITEVRCDPPYVVYPPRVKREFTCDNTVTVTDSLVHLKDVIGQPNSCEP